jgi:hypothetical protein
MTHSIILSNKILPWLRSTVFRKRERDFLLVLINAMGSPYPPIHLWDYLLFLIPEIVEPQGKGKVTIGVGTAL